MVVGMLALHSSAQAWQIWAHRRQMSGACGLWRAIAATASSQICAHSRSWAMQAAIIWTSDSFRQAAAQVLQAMTQAWQASMQAL